MKIAVAGTGYVGLSNAVLLSQHNEVKAVDVIQEKVDLINNKKSPIADKEIEEYLACKNLNLAATTDAESAYKNADFVIISTPTNYDVEKNFFDTSSIEVVINLVKKYNPDEITQKRDELKDKLKFMPSSEAKDLLQEIIENEGGFILDTLLKYVQ